MTESNTQQTPDSQALSGSAITRAASLVMIGFIFSRLLGLLRESIIGGVFGGGLTYDAYIAASRPPETLFLVIAGGAIGSAFIPTFTDLIVKDKRESAYRLTSSIINLLLLTMIALCGLSFIFAAPLTDLLVPAFTAEGKDLTVGLLRVMLLTPIIFSVSGLLMGFLNAHQRFLMPALAPSFRNIGIIFGAIVLAPSMGVMGLAWGTVIGAVLHLLIQLPAVFATKYPYRPLIELRHPGVREVARLMLPRVVGLAIVQLNFWVNTILASDMPEGSIGALWRAWFIMLLPQGVVAQSVATAVFPTFAAQVSEGKTDDLRETLGQVLRSVLFLSLPATVGLIMLRLPIVRLLFERGEFTLTDSEATAWALLFFSMGLVAHALVEIVTRAFYAMHDTKTPVLIGGGAMALNVILSLILINFIGSPDNLMRGTFAGLALANTIATTLEGVLLLLLLGPRVGGMEGRRMTVGLLRAGLASAGMGVALWLMLPIIDQVGLLIGTLGGIAIGGAIFWALALLFKSETAQMFTGFVLSQVKTK